MEYFPGFNTLQLSEEVKSLLYRLGETPANFTGRIIFMSMFNYISFGTKDNEEENVWRMPNSFLCVQRDRLKASDRYDHEQFMESFSTMSNLSKASLQQATKITETLTESMVSQSNSSGLFSKDSIRCSSVKKSKV